ncbi:MAG: alpha-amlyase, partial [Gemmatimonadetes bacterium]|nr:alpha-amlyase [Gemmatimonadota bacterium]
MPIRHLLRLAALAPALLLWGCRALRSGSALPCTTPPSWSRNANIYELNLRQFTPTGTLQAAAEHLPRLCELGVDIIWLMPIHPIGEDRRKGTLGSYYSVRDYRGVNPEFGNLQDMKSFVNQAHDLRMRVILDWVANHCAWDNPLVSEHPDWFTRDDAGHMVAPVPDWSDVVDLDYDDPELRRYMIDSLLFWVREAD